MRRQLAIVTLVGLFGLAMTATDARACHKNKRCANPTPACYQPCPPPAPVCYQPCPPQPKKTCGTCGGHHGLLGGMKCHRKAKMACAPVCPPAPCAPIYYGAPVAYAAPQTYATGQTYAAPQVPVKSTPQVPAKAAPQG